MGRREARARFVLKAPSPGGGTMTEHYFPAEHDTAAIVPRLTAEGAAMLGVSSGLSLGVRAAYADYDWAGRSAAGTEPIPSHPAS